MNSVTIGRVVWPGLVGVGAGLVKNGIMLLDYGKRASAVEIGSITRHLRETNAGQIVWKFQSEMSLRHNAGMPNYGAEHLAEDLVKVQAEMTVPWGINVAVTPGISDSREAAIDLRSTVSTILASGVEPDWLTINVASPDTSDKVELLSEPDRVKQIVDSVKSEVARYDNPPVWLKLGPSMPNERLSALVKVALETQIEAIIVGNTMPDLDGGGWCGKVVQAQSNAALWWIRQLVGDSIPLIGLGGVLQGKDAKHKLDLGARAVMVVSAMLTRGREAAREIETEIQ